MRTIGLMANVGLAVVIAVLGAGCSASHTTGEGPECGPVRCASDEICCNASCGICTRPGEGCVPIACEHDGGTPADDAAMVAPCAAMDAHGQGACRGILGWAWDGTSCQSIGGCECVGADCGALSGSPAACAAAHEVCLPPCGGLGGTTCPEGFYCDFPDRYCGGDDSLGTCRARPDGCPEPGGVLVCGCDGRDHVSECEARLSGVDVAFVGSCADPGA